jgi:hypothetical protein
VFSESLKSPLLALWHTRAIMGRAVYKATRYQSPLPPIV